MDISIIIPTLNEAENLKQLIPHLKEGLKGLRYEIIISDASSQDDSEDLVKSLGAQFLTSPKKGRATQMNYGTSFAKSDLLYFVHADARPPVDFMAQLKKAREEDYKIGSFRFIFDDNRGLRKFNSYCTRFDLPFCRGGDQTLFITRTLFDKLNGFRSDFIIMEDYDMIKRARKSNRFKIIQDDVTVSARKYEDNSWLRVQLANSAIFTMYRTGWFSQKKMYDTYKKLLNYR